MARIEKLTQEEFSRACDEKAKQGYRFDRVDYKNKALIFKEVYPGAAEDKAKNRR